MGAGLAFSESIFAQKVVATPAKTTGNIMPKVMPRTVPALEVIALSRLTFGPRPGDFERFRKLGRTPTAQLSGFLEQQFDAAKIKDDNCENRIKAEKLASLDKPLAQLFSDYTLVADKMRQEEKMMAEPPEGKSGQPAAKGDFKAEKKDENKLRLEPINDLERATWLRAVYSERQFFERVVGFWHDHFSIFGWEPKISPVFTHYDREVIRKNAFGNFREMLEAVAKSPAMLIYLDNGINQSGNPNENYARELFELHTLGAENYLGTRDRSKVSGYGSGKPIGYVDGDVYEAARCFTGWRIDQGKNSNDTGVFDYYEQWHDRFQKIVLGKHLKEYQPPLSDGHTVLDLVAQHPGTARFIARKMCRRFICDEPPEALVAKVAAEFLKEHKAHDQIKKVLRVIILSPEFEKTWAQKIRRPFESTVAFLRAMSVDMAADDKFLRNFENTGQKLFGNRTPDGYPDVHTKWANANSLTERWRLVNQVLTDQMPRTKANMAPIIAFDNDPNKTVTAIVNIMGRPISLKTQNAVKQFLSQNQNRPRGGMFAAGLLFMSPDFQWT